MTSKNEDEDDYYEEEEFEQIEIETSRIKSSISSRIKTPLKGSSTKSPVAAGY